MSQFITFETGINKPLEWVQPKGLERIFDLREGEKLFAKLVFQSAWGSLARGSCSEGEWTFKRVGFFNPRITVRRPGEEHDLATYFPRWSGSQGEIRFSGGANYHWQATNFWATRFHISDSQGNLLLVYSSGVEEAKLSDFFKHQARQTIEPAASTLRELPILALLGWYLIILHQEDMAAVAATAAVAD